MNTMIKRAVSALLILTLLALLAGCGAKPPVPEYTVTFDLNGGELISGELTQTVKEGESAVPPQAENGRKELSWEGSFENITADTVVTAKWSKVAMDTSDLAEYVQARTVTVNVKTINGGSGSGSGFFIDSEGTVVTNFHVIDLAAEISVEAGSGASYPVKKVVDFSNIYDLAILKIDLPDSPYLEISDENVRTGERVYAVGSALGELKGTFTAGIVSSAARSYGKSECIQMDAAISPGNSGGPLVNAYGEVVGINTASYTSGENLNLAIKVSQLELLARDKNWSVKELKEWYERETARSWSTVYIDGNNEPHYYYSLINTYQQVTGATCLYSVDTYTGEADMHEGYLDMYDVYVYEYKTDEYDRYVEYLKSIGFEYDDSESADVGTSYYYLNEKDDVEIELFVLGDFTQIWIAPIHL